MRAITYHAAARLVKRGTAGHGHQSTHYAASPAGGSRGRPGSYTGRMRKTAAARQQRASRNETPVVGLRIIGGSLRRPQAAIQRRLADAADERPRPRGGLQPARPAVVGSHAIDLFAGTGALGLEAISRGAARATFIERHLPTLKLIEAKRGRARRGGANRGRSLATPLSGRRSFVARGWHAAGRLLLAAVRLLRRAASRNAGADRPLGRRCPAGSQIVVEADERFDFGLLPRPEAVGRAQVSASSCRLAVGTSYSLSTLQIAMTRCQPAHTTSPTA